MSCPKASAPFNVEDRLTASYTFGQRVADSVARFGGSGPFIIRNFIHDDGYLDADQCPASFWLEFTFLSVHLAQSCAFYDWRRFKLL